jgi:SAM-dependent methyltransferase
VVNEYTRSWHRTFLEPSSPSGPRAELTEVQIGFLKRQLPLPDFKRVLDVCCGLGRHSIALGHAGYEVLGIERDARLVAQASQSTSGARFLRMDMRDLDDLEERVDSVICMWQSFGYFEHEQNESVLKSMSGKLRVGGRLVLDLYNRNYFHAVGTSTGGEFRTNQVLTRTEQWRYLETEAQLEVRIDWPSGEQDRFSWRLYSPEEIIAMGGRCSLSPLLVCSEFQPDQISGNRRKSFQVVFERTSRA